MRFLVVAFVFRSFTPLAGQLFYSAIPGQYQAAGPFYNSQPSYHSDPKYYAESQMPLPYYQNYQPAQKNYQQVQATKGYSPPPQPSTEVPRAFVESLKLPQPMQMPPIVLSPPPAEQEISSPPARKRPQTQRQKYKVPKDDNKQAVQSEAQERPAEDSYEDLSMPEEIEEAPSQSQTPNAPAYNPNAFQQPSFGQPPYPQPPPSAAYGVINVKFSEVEHSCKEVKICVPIDPKSCWNGDQQAIRSIVLNQTENTQDSSQQELTRKRRKLKKVVFSMPTTPSPEKKSAGPSGPTAMTKRKHTASAGENQAPYKIFELADPKKKIAFEPGASTPNPSDN